MALAGLGEGRYGEPARPDCYPHGYMTANYTCACWDPTIYKGPTCKENCKQYCNNRGTCREGNATVCDCFDPVRWRGDRCEISVCGDHGLVIAGDYLVGAYPEGIRLVTATVLSSVAGALSCLG